MPVKHSFHSHLLPLVIALGTVLSAAPAMAQGAGEVEFARGVGFAQTPGQAPRTLGKGLMLQEGDRLTTAEGASAIIKLQDGTRMTVRPNSELVLQQYQFKENADNNSMVMQLLRGGLRAVTGLISKGSANAARIQTNTATIGIRGTDFDARLCTTDCGNEASQISERARPNAALASARVIEAQGQLNALDTRGQRRLLANGAAVYPGDVVETGPGTRAVLAFRDESRVTIGSITRFRVDNFVFDEQNPSEGRFLVSLLRGSVRALTGLIAKANNRNVGFSTATATIGVRGTGLDLDCTGDCASDTDVPAGTTTSDASGHGQKRPAARGLSQSLVYRGESANLMRTSFADSRNDMQPELVAQAAGDGGSAGSGLTVWTWLGSVVVNSRGQTALQVLQAGQGLFISPTGIRPLTTPPPNNLPNPQTITPPPGTFSKSDVPENKEGLYVFVRDGHIEMTTTREVVQLGRGEAGFAGNDGSAGRPNIIPRFIDFDKLPMPNAKNPMLVSVLNDALKQVTVCK